MAHTLLTLHRPISDFSFYFFFIFVVVGAKDSTLILLGTAVFVVAM